MNLEKALAIGDNAVKQRKAKQTHQNTYVLRYSNNPKDTNPQRMVGHTITGLAKRFLEACPGVDFAYIVDKSETKLFRTFNKKNGKKFINPNPKKRTVK